MSVCVCVCVVRVCGRIYAPAIPRLALLRRIIRALVVALEATALARRGVFVRKRRKEVLHNDRVDLEPLREDLHRAAWRGLLGLLVILLRVLVDAVTADDAPHAVHAHEELLVDEEQAAALARLCVALHEPRKPSRRVGAQTPHLVAALDARREKRRIFEERNVLLRAGKQRAADLSRHGGHHIVNPRRVRRLCIERREERDP